MLGAVAGSASFRKPDYYGTGELAGTEKMSLCGMVYNGVKDKGEEVCVHNLNDRAHTHHCGAYCHAREAFLGYRGVYYLIRKLFDKAFRDLEAAAVYSHILSYKDYVSVLSH